MTSHFPWTAFNGVFLYKYNGKKCLVDEISKAYI